MSAGRRALLRAAPALLAALAACGGGGPPTQYYRLAPVPGTPVPGAAAGAPAVGVRGISLPGTLEQTNIVKPSGAYEFDSYSSALWAEPLADMLRDVLVQDLGQRLPRATVISSGGAIAAPRDVLVEINVLRFDPDAAGQITLSAQIAVKSGSSGQLWLTRNFQSTAASGAGVTGMVASMSALWGQAADETAATIASAWAAHAADALNPP